MKIVILMTADYPVREGIGSYCMDLAKSLSEEEYLVSVICPSGSANCTHIINSSLTVHEVKTTAIPILKYFHFKKLCESLINSFGTVDVIHYNSPLMLPLSEKQGCRKFVLTLHSLVSKSHESYKYVNIVFKLKEWFALTVGRYIENSIIKKSDKVIAVSLDTLRELDSYEADKSVLIENTVDVDHYVDYGTSRRNEFLVVSRLDIGKGLEALIKAVIELKEDFRNYGYKLRIVGDGTLKSRLEHIVLSGGCQDYIAFQGKVDQKELPKLYNESKFLVSNSDYETGPRSVLEASASGALVLSTDTGLVRIHKDLCGINISEMGLPESLKYAMSMDELSFARKKEVSYSYCRRNFSSGRALIRIKNLYEV